MNTSKYFIPDSVNADLAKVAVIETSTLPWLPSPQSGVERRLLDRIGSEVARATSLVRYARDSYFPQHSHGAGEEFLVIKGTFCDEHGEYPTGSYVRNPPGSYHTPFTQQGCIIFVKLRQMDNDEKRRVFVDTNRLEWDTENGRSIKTLFNSEQESVSIERLSPGATLKQPAMSGEELFVLSGSLNYQDKNYGRNSWLRFPPEHSRQLQTLDGVEFWVKRGHLAGELR